MMDFYPTRHITTGLVAQIIHKGGELGSGQLWSSMDTKER